MQRWIVGMAYPVIEGNAIFLERAGRQVVFEIGKQNGFVVNRQCDFVGIFEFPGAFEERRKPNDFRFVKSGAGLNHLAVGPSCSLS